MRFNILTNLVNNPIVVWEENAYLKLYYDDRATCQINNFQINNFLKYYNEKP